MYMVLKQLKLNKVIEEDVLNIISSEYVNWNKLSGKTVLISGANGFLPSYLVYTLLALNDQLGFNIKVVALVRNIHKAHARFKTIIERNDFTLLLHDVTFPLSISEKIDFIIHAASQASPSYYGIDPVGTLNANTLGTNNLLQLAHKHKVENFLFFSSSEIYGTVTSEVTHISEIDYGYIDPINVRACYSESKRLGETMCISWMHQFNVPVTIVRPFHTYGPGIDLNDGRVFADFVADIAFSRDIVMKSDGSAIRAYCYLSDATVAFFLALLHGKQGEAFNVGNSNCEISVLDLSEKLVALFPEKKLKVIRKEIHREGYLKSSVHRVVPDMKKIIGLGWIPKISIEEGFSRTIKSCEIDINSIHS
jgi:UDP-glucuronate decarboxylase